MGPWLALLRWNADHYFGERGKTSTRQRPQPKKNRRSFAGTLDTTLIGFLYQPWRFFAPGLGRTFIWKNGHALMYLRPGFGVMVSTASGVGTTVV
jgi:hypothetical protein